MTEYEMTDIMMSRFATMTDQAALYFALVSGYLLAAFVVGARLTRLQVIVVNSLFVIWTLGLLVGWNSALDAVRELELAIHQLNQPSVGGDLSASAASAYSFSLVQIIGIIASLIFMWSVRRAKTE
jgi:hypothetical protein